MMYGFDFLRWAKALTTQLSYVTETRQMATTFMRSMVTAPNLRRSSLFTSTMFYPGYLINDRVLSHADNDHARGSRLVSGFRQSCRLDLKRLRLRASERKAECSRNVSE